MPILGPLWAPNGAGAGTDNSVAGGGGGAGTFKCTGTTGAATVTLTFYNAPNGWDCRASDLTTTADLLVPTGGAANTCTFSATSITQNDVIRFTALPF